MIAIKQLTLKSIGIYLLKILALALIYRLAAVLGLSLAFAQPNSSPVWPPTGIAIAALLLFGVNLWPGITLGVLIGSLLTGAPPLLAFGMALGNTLEAVAAALLLKHVVHFRNELDRLRDVVGLVLVSLLAAAISASSGTAAVILTYHRAWSDFGLIWTTWWIGDLLGALVVAPLLLSWLTGNLGKPSKRIFIEGITLFVILAAVTWYVFSNQPPVGILHQALLYVIFPFMIWNALRFGQRGASLGITLVSGIAIWSTVSNRGPFSHESLNNSLILLQTFLGVVSITSLILAAIAIQNSFLYDTVLKGNERLHALSQRLMKTQEEERLHLSRELHDESGQLLAALMVQLGLLDRDAANSADMQPRVQELKRITGDIQTNLHRLAVNLRPASLDHVGLVTTLQQYVADFSRQHNIKVDFEAVGMEKVRLPLETETAVFRIVQESLTNVILHAQATRVDVLLNRHNHHLVAVVEDDGIGFAPATSAVDEHLGLFGMRERVEMLGGNFAIESAQGKGTTVKVEIPCGD